MFHHASKIQQSDEEGYHSDHTGRQQGLRIDIAQHERHRAASVPRGHRIEDPREPYLGVEGGVQQHEELQNQRAARQVPAVHGMGARQFCSELAMLGHILSRQPCLEASRCLGTWIYTTWHPA